MSTPRSIRFDPPVLGRLRTYAHRRPGLTSSAAAALLVDEGLRMEEHPGIVFRDGPLGRRAVVIGGPDVWEVVRTVRLTRRAEPDLDEGALLALVTENTGVSERMLRIALDYRASFPEEIDLLVDDADEAERHGLAARQRTQDLLEP
jgi:hypothetical protein